MTRKTLFRHVLALKLLSAGHYAAYFWALPKNAKDWFCHERRQRWAFAKIAMDILVNYLPLSSQVSPVGTKIGDTIKVRQPARFCR